MTAGDKVFGQRVVRKPIGPKRSFTATAELKSLGGQEPYFSVTGEERNLRRRGDNQVEVAGQLHDEQHQHAPELDPVARVHLSNEQGVPMHAVANALYHAGVGKYSNQNMGHLASHLRVSEDDARSISSRVHSAKDPQAEMSGVVEGLKPRWAEEAQSAKRVLGISGRSVHPRSGRLGMNE